MTEDEAKTKYCCGPQTVAVAIIITAPVGTAEVDNETAGKCVASACMAWRAGPSATDIQKWVAFDRPRVRPGETYESSGEWVDLPAGERRGFCGLASTPSRMGRR
jgi:hypothetical protein